MKYTISLALLGILIGYMMGAFVGASFNIATWGEGWRMFWACTMLSLGFIGAAVGVNAKLKGKK